MRIEKLVVIGVGLIGASCALAMRAAGAVGQVIGIGRSQENLRRAVARGVIDRGMMLGDDWTRELTDADFVLIAIPVAQYRETLTALAPALARGAVVTDAGSTKQDVVLAARETLNDRLPQFVPGHPIAGNERSGADAGDASLYVGRQVILTPLPETSVAALRRVEEFWTMCGARVERLDPARHDRIMAAVSHLPHLLAFTLVAELASRQDSAEYMSNAGSGFRDFTRIAGSSPEMWRDIALANRDALLTELVAYRGALDALMLSIEHGDRAALDAMLGRAAETRRRWGETAAGVGVGAAT
ncbi:MAG TPA: prephenate dehydrogenase/arogenate dehydrogenase family protein [Casimicrobiaceae bacterium]|nr:prephenate dehydrogenase/arogenate dehydrogenase family protein [Casimicrobiaceae bacterium]